MCSECVVFTTRVAETMETCDTTLRLRRRSTFAELNVAVAESAEISSVVAEARPWPSHDCCSCTELGALSTLGTVHAAKLRIFRAVVISARVVALVTLPVSMVRELAAHGENISRNI